MESTIFILCYNPNGKPNTKPGLVTRLYCNNIKKHIRDSPQSKKLVIFGANTTYYRVVTNYFKAQQAITAECFPTTEAFAEKGGKIYFDGLCEQMSKTADFNIVICSNIFAKNFIKYLFAEKKLHRIFNNNSVIDATEVSPLAGLVIKFYYGCIYQILSYKDWGDHYDQCFDIVTTYNAMYYECEESDDDDEESQSFKPVINPFTKRTDGHYVE